MSTLACFLSLSWSKLKLCSANHRVGYFSNLACDWLSIVWAYSEQETENRPGRGRSWITGLAEISGFNCSRPEFGATRKQPSMSLQWHHNGRDGTWNHQPHHCLLDHLFMRRSKKIPKLCVTGLCVGKFTGDRRMPRSNGQYRGKCFLLMTSWCHIAGAASDGVRLPDRCTTSCVVPCSVNWEAFRCLLPSDVSWAMLASPRPKMSWRWNHHSSARVSNGVN